MTTEWDKTSDSGERLHKTRFYQCGNFRTGGLYKVVYDVVKKTGEVQVRYDQREKLQKTYRSEAEMWEDCDK